VGAAVWLHTVLLAFILNRRRSKARRDKAVHVAANNNGGNALTPELELAQLSAAVDSPSSDDLGEL
jgi:hypothetical protein